MLKVIGTLKKRKPTVLFLAGSLMDPCVYDQIEAVAGFQFVAIDYCKSEGPWDVTSLGRRIIELIDAMELGPTVLVGYSAGGVIAMAASSMASHRIAGMLLSNTGPCGKGHGDAHFPQKILENWGEEAFAANFFTRCFSRPIPPFLELRLQAYIKGVDARAAYEISQSLREVDYRESLRCVTCPVVIAHGQDDSIRTVEHVRMMKECMPQAKVFMLKGGHTIMVENKEEWQDAFHFLLEKVQKEQVTHEKEEC